MEKRDPAPTTGQQPGTLLQVIDSTSEDINPSARGAFIWFLDLARPGGRYVRYRSDARPGPGAGLWRTYGSHPSERISPYAIIGIVPGRHGVEVTTLLPTTEELRIYEGDFDRVATDLYRAGQRRGCRADRQMIFWALYDLCTEIRRQAAARGCVL